MEREQPEVNAQNRRRNAGEPIRRLDSTPPQRAGAGRRPLGIAALHPHAPLHCGAGEFGSGRFAAYKARLSTLIFSCIEGR
jgi:hypothetical protein